jgi:hypothetical protein
MDENFFFLTFLFSFLSLAQDSQSKY